MILADFAVVAIDNGRGADRRAYIQETGGPGHSRNFPGHRPTEWRRPKLHDPVLVRRVDGHRETEPTDFPRSLRTFERTEGQCQRLSLIRAAVY